AAKISAWVLAASILLVAALIGTVWIAGNTDPGRAWIERLTYRLTSGYVKLSGLGGSFPTQLTLDELQLIDHQGVWLTADHVSLRWSPLRLLERRIYVDELRLKRLHMERAPVGDGKGGGGSIPHIDVGEFSMDAVELGAPLVGTPATVSLRGRLELRSLQNADADVTARRLDGEGEYTLHLKLDPKRMDASLAVHEPAGGPLENLLSLPGLGALSATATVQGPRNEERVDVVLDAGPLHADIHGSVDLTHQSADVEYSLKAAAMAPRPEVAWAELALKGNWHGTLTAPTADGRLEVHGLKILGTTQIPRLNAELAARDGKLGVHGVVDGLEIPGPQPRLFAKDPLTIDASVELDAAARPLDLTATHSLFKLGAHADTAQVSGAEQRATVALTVADLSSFAAFAGQDVRGNATINARLAHARGSSTIAADVDLGLSGGSAAWIPMVGPKVVLKVEGGMTDDGIKVQSLQVAGNGMTLTASGTASRAPPEAAAANFIKDLKARWQLEVSNLAMLSSDVAGDLKASGELRGAPAMLAADAEVTSHLSVRGSPSGTVEATLHARGLPKSPSGAIQAHGMLDGAPLNLDAALDRIGGKAFRLLVRRADWKSAHLEGDMTADAALTQSHGQLHLHVGQLDDFDRLLGVNLTGSVDGSLGFNPKQGHAQAHLTLDGSNVGVGQFAGDMHVLADGAAGAIAVQLSAQLPKLYGFPATAAAAATLNLDARQLQLSSLSVAYRGETFRLLSPAQLSFAKGVSVDELKIGAREAVFDLKGQVAPTLDLSASLLHVKPDLVNVFAPELLASGTIGAQARLQGIVSNPTGSLKADVDDLRFADEAATGLPAVQLHATAQLADDTAALQATLNAGPGSQLKASGNVPLNPDGALDLKIGGKLDVGMANPLLEARGLHAAGKLTVDATVTGNSGAPVVGGGITLSEGSLRDYTRGVNLSDIEAAVVGNEAGLLIKNFKATAVSGSVAMTGSFGVLQPGMPLDLKITAKNAQPVASNIITANLDADLHISGKARERIDVAGLIHVIRATIGIPNSLPPEVAVLDVRRRGKPAPPPGAKQLIVGIDIIVRAPQEILVQGRGLDAEMGGEIHLKGTSDELLASGDFNLQRGWFTLAGNRLEFKEGRVGFDGAGLRKKIDPTLDFTAETTQAEYTIKLQITGPADAPRFDFSSSPSLPQDDIMARLLFGVPGSQLTAFQYAQIAAALATLSGVGGNGINPLVKLQKTLGLDRLTVGTNTTSTATGTENSGAAIAAGRYVSKRVYVEGKQTTTGTSQVQIDVDLTKHLKLQTRLGNGTAITQGTTPENDPGSSIGLSYQFEY
ncbi:MAG: translocation and assembly module TamB, partial [Gammaproteobacteria bacterium]|nr:translocation and assembly module TamB [Gammaproteobacteria bacterium]